MNCVQELIKKLKYKDGAALVLNPPEGYHLGIETIPSSDEQLYNFVQLFVNNSEDVKAWLPKTLSILKEDAVFWITYPKQSSKVKTDINRDSLFKLVQELSPYRAVSNVSVDEKWSALRFRHQEKVKTQK
jgi:hypothetical protein